MMPYMAGSPLVQIGMQIRPNLEIWEQLAGHHTIPFFMRITV
jgi:hypothetical protein